MDKPILDRSILSQQFDELGLGRGEAVLIHGSLSSLGHVDGGAPSVVAALLDRLGPYGTVAAPTLTGSEELTVENPPTIDAANAPCWTGAIPEAVRAYPGALRSYHPTHSIAAIGPLSDWLCATHHLSPTPCGYLSPYVRLSMRSGKILMLGVGLDTCTTFHSCEEMARTPYVCQRETAAGAVILADGKRLETPVLLHDYNGPDRDYPAFEPVLEKRKVLTVGRVGEAKVLLIDSKKLVETVMAFLARDLYAVTKERRMPLDDSFLDETGPVRLWTAPAKSETDSEGEECVPCDSERT